PGPSPDRPMGSWVSDLSWTSLLPGPGGDFAKFLKVGKHPRASQGQASQPLTLRRPPTLPTCQGGPPVPSPSTNLDLPQPRTIKSGLGQEFPSNPEKKRPHPGRRAPGFTPAEGRTECAWS